MKVLKTNLHRSIFVMLLLWSWTASGQTIKPIGRSINEHGDTITLFSIQSEREIVYHLQMCQDILARFTALSQIDSVLKAQNISLKQKNELLSSQLKESQNENSLHGVKEEILQKDLDKSAKENKKLRVEKNIYIVAVGVLSIVSLTLLLSR